MFLRQVQQEHDVEVPAIHHVETVCEILQKPKTKTKKKDNVPVQGDLLGDLPQWLEEFTEHVVDEGVSVSLDTPASTAHDSDSEPSRKVVSRKHSIFTHFRKDRHCEVCKRTKITMAPCKKRTGDAVPRAENFGDLITADHKVLSEGCESRNNHRYAVVVQDLATHWIQSYPCKTKTSQETELIYESFSSRLQSRKSSVQTCFWMLTNPVKIDYGIIVHQRHIDPRHMALLKERYAELKKGRLLCCRNLAWMKNGGLIPWSAIAICEMFKTSWQMEKHLRKAIWRTIQRSGHSVWRHG